MNALWVVIFIFSFPAWAARKACEAGLSTPAIKFVRLLPTGLKERSITPEGLRRMIESATPTNPIEDERGIDNLSRKNALQREIPRITREQWKLVVARAIEIEREHRQEQKQVDQAREDTRNIFAIIPTDFTFPQGEGPIQYFVSSQEEVFICTRAADYTYVHNLTKRTGFKIQGQLADIHSNDFFETAKGEVLFVLLANDRLSVHEARTGEPWFNFDLSSRTGLDRFRPLIFEKNGSPHLSIGYHNSNMFEVFAHTASYIFPIFKGMEKFESNALEISLFVARLSNGHLYSYWGEQTPNGFTGHVNNLSTGREEFKRSVSTDSALFLHHTLIWNHGVEPLYQQVGNDSAPWNILDNATQALKPLKFSAARFFMRHLLDFKGEAIGIEVLDNDKKPERQLRITNIMKNQTRTVDVVFNEGGGIWDDQQTGFTTPKGIFAMAWEWARFRPVRLHLYNYETSELLPLTIPPEISAVRGVFYNPTDGRILLIGGTSANRWKIYQVYGPDGSTR